MNGKCVTDQELRESLELNNWNRQKTATQLGVHVRTVARRIETLERRGEVVPMNPYHLALSAGEISKALYKNKGNVTATARDLDLSLSTTRKYLIRYELIGRKRIVFCKGCPFFQCCPLVGEAKKSAVIQPIDCPLLTCPEAIKARMHKKDLK